MDETGMIDFAFDPEALAQAQQQPVNVATVSTPSSQPDFNQAGSGDQGAILRGGIAVVSSIADAAARISQLPAQFAFNRAVAQQNDQIARQQLAVQGQIATLGAKTQLLQAQAAYNKAAGVITSSPLVLILTVAGVVVGALALVRKK